MKKFFLICSLFLIACSNTSQFVETKSESIEGEAVEMADVSEKLDYINEQFSFALNIPEGFSPRILPDDAGILLEKTLSWTIPHEKTDPKEYKLEIVVLPFENLEEFEDLGIFLASEYEGYTLEFADYPNLSGVYVDEGVAKSTAVRHFFSLSKNKDFIYEIYMKLPPIYYNEHKQFFVDFIKGIVIL